LTYKIYGLRAIGSDDIRYVGYTSRTLKRRLLEHIKERNRYDSHKNHWICSLDCQIEIVLLEDNIDTQLLAREKEVYYISGYKHLGYKLTNTSSGGEAHSGCKHSEKTKLRLSEMNKGKVLSAEHRAKMSISRSGGKRTDEQKKSMALGKLGIKNPQYGKTGALSHTSKPVTQYTLDGELIKHWGGATEAATTLKLTQSKISKCCAGAQNQTGGFRWSFTGAELAPVTKIGESRIARLKSV
jgi:hypothetical protein